MSNPQAQQQSVAARLEVISQTSITDGLYPLKAFHMFLAFSIHCPSTPHFVAIERDGAAERGDVTCSAPLCARGAGRQSAYTQESLRTILTSSMLGPDSH